MATSPETLHENAPDFRAPPPSPIATAATRRSSFLCDGDLTGFLEHSFCVPDLILPDRIFPREISIKNLPEIDFQSLISLGNGSVSKILESIVRIGCFQLLNHGISGDLIRSVSIAAADIFRISPEGKAIVSRSLERRYGFEDFSGEEGMEMSEEFVWCRDEGLKLAMEGIWSDGYTNFSRKIENLSTQIENVARKVLMVLSENTFRKTTKKTELIDRQELVGLVCCLYKHSRNTLSADRWVSSLKSDIVRMLIKGSDYSHALCVHVCDGSSEFHVYSNKGWKSFCPSRNAIVFTIGDQIQAWSGGQFKNVIGRPVFKVKNEDSISMAFQYSPPTIIQTFQGSKEKAISLRQQLMLALLLTIVFHFFLHF